MEKPISYYDWKLHFRNNPNNKINPSPIPFDNNFNDLLKIFCKKENLHKSGGIKSSQFTFRDVNLTKGIVKSLIKLPDDEKFQIEINRKQKYIFHECQEFKFVNKFRKYFCSHLIRLFFLLDEIDKEGTIELLKHISTHDYDFFPKLKYTKNDKKSK